MEGKIEKVNLFNLLQLLQMEKRSCQLAIPMNGAVGTLHIDSGQLIDAVYKQEPPESSAYQILQQPVVDVTITAAQKKRKRTIHHSLDHILMESVRRQDERRHAQQAGQEEAQSSKSSTLGNTQSRQENLNSKKENSMDSIKQVLANAMEIEGAIGVALVSLESGMSLGSTGSGLNLDMEVAAAAITSVVQAKIRAIKDLNLKGEHIEDILVTLSNQYHLIRIIESDENLFLYIVLNRKQANLGMARHKLSTLESDIRI